MAANRQYFPPVDLYELSASLPAQTLRILREEGRGETESLVFWAGRISAPRMEIGTIIVPKGKGVQKHSDFLRLSEEVMFRVAELMDPPGLVLAAQIHTHGMLAFHSHTDDFYGFRSPGFLSIVIANHAESVTASLDTWGIFQCTDGKSFRRLPAHEVRRRFRFRDDLTLSILEATDE
jgi:hypothetical protein